MLLLKLDEIIKLHKYIFISLSTELAQSKHLLKNSGDDGVAVISMKWVRSF